MSSIKTDFAVEKLRGSENFHNWVFAMENLLDFKGLRDCIVPSETVANAAKEQDVQKLIQAKSTIVLSVDSSLYVHIRRASSALEVWRIFHSMYEDQGVLGSVSLLLNFVSTRLENCDGMQDYLDKLTTYVNKLSAIGINLPDPLVAAFMLAGLPAEYHSFIMGLQGNITQLSTQAIKMRLLDCHAGLFEQNQQRNAVFLTKAGNKKNSKKNSALVCYSCGKSGHKKSSCFKKSGGGDKQKTGSSDKLAFACFAKEPQKDDWFMDSGASYHMTANESILYEKEKPIIRDIKTADDSKVNVRAMGKANLILNDKEIEFDQVLHIPDLTANLLSVYQITQKDNVVVFDKNWCTVYGADKALVARCKPKNGVYVFQNEIPACMLSRGKVETAVTWHRRFGHLNYNSLCKMRDGAVDGMKFSNSNVGLINCKICAEGKQTRLPFELSDNKTSHVLELIHSDLIGPMETRSIGGARYILTFVDDFSRKIFVFFLKEKSQVFGTFVNFKTFVENQTEKSIKILRTDNGLEYLSNAFQTFCQSNGIQHQLTNVYTPQQNGTAERMNRTIIEKAKCMLFDADLSKCFWAEACNMAAYVINRSVCARWPDSTPEEVWTGRKIDVTNLRIFGSPVMVHVPKEKRKKLDRKSSEMIFVGYDADTKGFRCMDRNTRALTISRDVIFHEKDNSSSIIFTNQEESSLVRVSPQFINFRNNANDEQEDMDYEDDDLANQVVDEEIEDVEMSMSESYACISKCIDDEDYPLSATEALKREDGDKWKQAMDDEMNSLAENKTWILVDRPIKCKTLKAKWIFTKKKNPDGEVIRYKARFVAKGCAQKHGIDFNETYAPVVRYSSIRFLMALAVKNGLKIDQMDVTTAYLHGDLEEEIYIEQPEGFADETNRVCLLKKSLYGLKQAGRQWNLKLDDTLKKFGLRKSKMDPCIYFNNDSSLIVAIYVDDLLIFWKDRSVLDHMKKALNTSFKMKDMGEAKVCLNININQTDGKIELDQSSYIKKVLQRFNMENCNPISTPSDSNQKLSINMNDGDDEKEKINSIPYQEAVGSLLYLAQCMRPDISFAVNDVSRFNSNYRLAHWKAVKRIMRYLKGTNDYKLKYENCDDELHGYCDSDWASDIDKRRSCTGFLFKMSGGAITWSSKRQPTIALSTTEAEYMAMTSAIQEALWLKQLANEVHYQIKNINIFCDNQGAIKLAESDAFRPRTKHIDIKYHFIRKYIEDSIINIKYISTEDMLADNLTKAVPKDKHILCSKFIGLIK